MRPKSKYNIVPKLSSQLEPLRSLAYNLCFGWRQEIRDLFQRMDPKLWTDCGHNPVLMLGLISQERLEELSRDQGFMAQMERVSQDFNRYLSQPRIQSEDYSPDLPFQVAYFSAEFGLSGCLPIYSGGLGILAGDHLKSASDLNVPLVGVGLLYQEGYFSQYLSSDGWQMETYPVNDFSNMPVKLIRDKEGKPMQVSVEFKGEKVNILIWRIDVGRVPLYLLDTNLPINSPESRRTTAQLYGGDREMRLRQEIVLGIGGVRALKTLGIEPTIIHMNEGHSAFSALERINILRKEKGLSFDAAREMVIATTVFTTHTPVPAGNDVFSPDLVQTYFGEYAKELGINFRVLLGYGRLDPRNEGEKFGMSTLALRLSSHANGVSRLHGKVSRSIWQKIWSHHPVEDVPIDHITNGIHVPTWISREMAFLLIRYLGPDWAEDPDNERVWEQIENIPSTELWRSHERCRDHLVAFARRLLTERLREKDMDPAEMQNAGEVLTPDAMTIGFSRRFATYKRATLIFRDPDRLDRILNNPKYPVQMIISGKAHPQDNEGKEFIKTIIHLSREARFHRRIVFLEDYNFHIAHVMVSGCDLWLNTPRRPLEACGTSGMKALANGSLNLSVLDGWWDEGYHSKCGWAIGHGEVYKDYNAQDNIESNDLYNLLEEEVIPLFYHRGHDDVPRGWVEKMKAGLRYLVPIFNSHRMVQEYMDRYYLPCSKRFNVLSSNDFEGAKDLASWRQKLMTGWAGVSVEKVTSGNGLDMPVGSELEIEAAVKLGTLAPDDVTVEAYYGRLDHNGDFAERETTALEVYDSKDGTYKFKGKIPCLETGRFGYTVRIMPSRNRLENPFIMGLVTWA
ncbi:MAG: alpha-glucan phosphorylase [Bacteroides sp. SM23_62_1]|nr:MAG: alpha-glucan phosphorylase [Bacteroides sp. SM23_62_1]